MEGYIGGRLVAATLAGAASEVRRHFGETVIRWPGADAVVPVKDTAERPSYHGDELSGQSGYH